MVMLGDDRGADIAGRKRRDSQRSLAKNAAVLDLFSNCLLDAPVQLLQVNCASTVSWAQSQKMPDWKDALV